MMKSLVLVVLFFLSLSAFGQSDRKTVKSKSRYLIEQYEVLVANDTVRTGSYRRYFREGNVLLEEGQYADNRRTGVWTFYDGKGKPELVYDYSAGKILTNNRLTLDSLGVIQQGDKNIGVRLTPPPIYLASLYQITGILVRESRVPIHLARAGVSDLSYQIAATVSPSGVLYRIIASHNDKDFTNKAKQATLLAFKDVNWLPGVYEGQEVTAVYLLPPVTLHTTAVVRIIR